MAHCKDIAPRPCVNPEECRIDIAFERGQRPRQVVGARLDAPDLALRGRDAILPPDPNIGWYGDGDLSMDVWCAWRTDGLWLAASVTDDVHATPDIGPGGFWKSDSLQIALDMLNDAEGDDEFGDDDLELGIVLTEGGEAVGSRCRLPHSLLPCTVACGRALSGRAGKSRMWEAAPAGDSGSDSHPWPQAGHPTTTGWMSRKRQASSSTRTWSPWAMLAW